jgi:hypothetical protein
MAKFKKGQSGNPRGKPKGCRNATTILFDELLKDNARELIEKAIELAKSGDGPALRLCIDRLAPARKDRPVWFDLPEVKQARTCWAPVEVNLWPAFPLFKCNW